MKKGKHLPKTTLVLKNTLSKELLEKEKEGKTKKWKLSLRQAKGREEKKGNHVGKEDRKGREGKLSSHISIVPQFSMFAENNDEEK